MLPFPGQSVKSWAASSGSWSQWCDVLSGLLHECFHGISAGLSPRLGWIPHRAAVALNMRLNAANMPVREGSTGQGT